MFQFLIHIVQIEQEYMLLNNPVGFSNITGYLFFTKSDTYLCDSIAVAVVMVRATNLV